MPPPKQRGFTLLELLVAIAIFSVVSIMAYAGLASVLKTRQILAAETARLAEIQRCVRLLGNDLRQSVDRGVRDAFGDPLPPLQVQSAGAGNAALLELTRAGYRNPLHLPRSQLQRVAWGIEDGQLWRESWRVLDRAQDSAPQRQVVCQDIERLELRLLDGENQWRPDWPPAGANGEAAAAASFPLALEVTFQLGDWGSLRRLIALPGATP